MYKKLFVFLFAIIVTFILYKTFSDEKLNYLSLGDNFAVGATPFNTINRSYADYFAEYLNNKKMLKNYNNSFSELNYRTTDLIKDIKLNREKTIRNKKISINELIAKSNIITISIGFNDLYYKVKYNKEEFKLDYSMKEYLDNMFDDIETLIKLIRKINDAPIYFIGYYNPHNINDGITDKMIKYLEDKFNTIKVSKKVYYVDIKKGFIINNNYVPNIENPLPSLEGYNYMANELINYYEKQKK